MVNEINLTPQTIGLASAGAAALGLTLADGLLTPTNRLKELAARRQRPAATPSTPRSARRAANRAAHAAGQAASSSAAAPTPEQAAEVARQLAEYGTPAPGEPAATLLHSDPLATRAPGYDPAFTPDPENFGTL